MVIRRFCSLMIDVSLKSYSNALFHHLKPTGCHTVTSDFLPPEVGCGAEVGGLAVCDARKQTLIWSQAS